MIKTVAEDKHKYRTYEDIDSTLRSFLCQYYMHGTPLVLRKKQAPIVEASVGRIKYFGGQEETILDEPFVLEAALNYYKQLDPGF
ncbi:hypothetical protein BGZ76_006874, partial [Entomortierella beljakovae]